MASSRRTSAANGLSESAVEESPASTGRTGSAPKGSRENPLSILELPFTVPIAGCYWLTYGDGGAIKLPYSPAGSVLRLEITSEVLDA